MKSIKSVLFKWVIVLFLVFPGGKTFSQTLSEQNIRAEATNSISFAGFRSDFMIFDMQLFELPAKGCTITITDESGSLFFEENVLVNSFARRYKIPKEGISRINFKVTGKGFSLNKSFTIKKEEKLVVIEE